MPEPNLFLSVSAQRKKSRMCKRRLQRSVISGEKSFDILSLFRWILAEFSEVACLTFFLSSKSTTGGSSYETTEFGRPDFGCMNARGRIVRVSYRFFMLRTHFDLSLPDILKNCRKNKIKKCTKKAT